MFTIPQNPAGSPNTLNEPIAMSESADILADLLSIVSGTSLPQVHDVDLVETLLFTAEKFDMPLPIAILRLVLPSLMKTHPIRVYGIACRMSWEAEAQEAAARTLAVNLLCPLNLLELRHVETSYVVKLLSLHERRRIQVNEELDSAGTFAANTDGFCRGLCREPCNRTSWAVFKLAWNREPWRFLGFEDSGERLEDTPELNAVLETKCKCGTKYYDASYTTQKLQALARSLPKTIQVSSLCSTIIRGDISLYACYSGSNL